MDRKAQGLSLNTIIIAIIVLIVLVVIIMVFTGYFGTKFTPGVTSCENSGGACQFAIDDGSNGCGFDSFGSQLAKLSGTCSGEQICCSKGLGSGEAPVKDSADCGKEGKAPCSTGQSCAAGLEPEGNQCLKTTRCKAAAGCVASADCTTPATGAGDCTGTNAGKVCCSVKKSGTQSLTPPSCNAKAGCQDASKCKTKAPASAGSCGTEQVCCDAV